MSGVTRGLFVSIEGGEGSGKSTQIALLKDAMARAGVDHVLTREPGGSPLAERVRALLVQPQGDEEWCARAEMLLFMAARVQHYEMTIAPALARGALVITDRFHDSSRMYQGCARALGVPFYDQLHRLMMGDIAPDLTLLLDIDPALGLERAARRGGDETRFEALGLEFHRILRAGFLSLAEREPQRICVIDATQSVEDVHRQIMGHIQARRG